MFSSDIRNAPTGIEPHWKNNNFDSDAWISKSHCCYAFCILRRLYILSYTPLYHFIITSYTKMLAVGFYSDRFSLL